MKEKDEILRALARTDEDKLLLAGLFDKLETCRTRCYPTHTRFLDLRERTVCAKALELAGAQRESVLWGGFPDAERVVAICYPDYLTADDAVSSEQSPLALLRATKSPADKLTHRDYLGALMGLGIDRSVVGDILVHDTGADLFVLADMADFILMNFLRAGRKRITLDHVPLTDFQPPVVQEVEREGSVASLRLDAVAALIFGMSRAQMQEQIAKGLVFVNQLQCLKNEAALAPGDRITVRGLGRARIVALGGVSRKGRQFVRYAKNV